MLKKVLWLFPVLISATCLSQEVQVNRQNKTIAVTADESVTADAEVAVLAIGFHNYAPSQDAAFRESVRAAEQITQALLKAKIAPNNIETEKLRLGRPEENEKWTEDMKKERRFEAQQGWHVTVSASQAQAAVDLAVIAVANEVDDVEWNVADPVTLQANASEAALAKARAVAEQMARGLGARLGELVYASNRAPVAKMWRGIPINTETATVEVEGQRAEENQPRLKLFPEKVKSNATVYAAFAIE